MRARRRTGKKQSNKRRLKEKGSNIIVFVVAVFCIVVGIYSINLKKQSEELEEKKTNLEEQLASEEQRTKDLEELEKYMQTKKYMEEVARERLGLVYPDEILIQPSNK